MKNIIKQNQLFEKINVKVEEAISFLEDEGESYKAELAMDLKNK